MFDRLGRSTTRALDIEAVTSPAREFANGPEGIYARGRRAQFGGRSRRNGSTVAHACLQSEVSSVTLAP